MKAITTKGLLAKFAHLTGAGSGTVVSIDLQGSITGVVTPITSAGTILLDGDQASPGNNMVYGTDGAGVKGWYNAIPPLDDVLTVGNTTAQSAIFTDGLTNTTTISPGGLSIDAENLAVNVGNNLVGSVMLQLNTTTGSFILGDAAGAILPTPSPWIYAAVPAITMSAGGNNNESFSADSNTHITTVLSSDINGQILLQTGGALAGVNVLIDNGADTITLNTSTGSIFITDSTINTVEITTAGIVALSGAATYTGTVAGAAAKNVINGLIMN